MSVVALKPSRAIMSRIFSSSSVSAARPGHEASDTGSPLCKASHCTRAYSIHASAWPGVSMTPSFM